MSIPARSVAESVLHLARMRHRRGGSDSGSGDPVDVLIPCLRGIDPIAARPLARDWLTTAERAVPGDPSDPADHQALTLLARTFRVPTDYFLDHQAASVVDAWLLLLEQQRDDFPSLAIHGPCRSRSIPHDVLASIETRLLHELSIRTGDPPAQ